MERPYPEAIVKDCLEPSQAPDRKLLFCWSLYQHIVTYIHLAAFCWYLGSKILLIKIASTDDKNENKVYKLSISLMNENNAVLSIL